MLISNFLERTQCIQCAQSLAGLWTRTLLFSYSVFKPRYLARLAEFRNKTTRNVLKTDELTFFCNLFFYRQKHNRSSQVPTMTFKGEVQEEFHYGRSRRQKSTHLSRNENLNKILSQETFLRLLDD